MATTGSYSPADSDVEMEDDITRCDKDEGASNSTGGPDDESALIHYELDVKEDLHGLHNSAERGPANNILSEKVSFYRSPRCSEQGKGTQFLPNDHHSTFQKSFPEVHFQVMNSAGPSYSPSNSNLEKCGIPQADNLKPSNASVTAEGIHSSENSSQLMKGGSPFRLLQDYASDDSSQNDNRSPLENLNPGTVSPSLTAGTTSLYGKTGGFRSPRKTGKVSKWSLSNKASEISLDSLREDKATGKTSIASGTTDKHVDNKKENDPYVNSAAAPKASLKKDDLGVGCVGVVSDSDKFQKGNEEKKAKCASVPHKVDEFGRYVRQGANDSDSDDSRYTGRHKKRGRSRSWSRSPIYRRRSPWRRREKRSCSRSWSPKRRRSRSRSPTYRRKGEFNIDNKRRDKGQAPPCFDFLRGRCYRGASCRYHHDSDKSNGSRHRRSKQYLEAPPSSKNCNIHEIKDVLPKFSVHDHEVRRPEKQLCQDIPADCIVAGKNGNSDQKREDSSRDALQSIISVQDGQLLDSDIRLSLSAREVAGKVSEVRVIKESDELNCQEEMESHQPLFVDSFPSQSVSDADAPKSLDETSLDVLPLKKSGIQQAQSKFSDRLPQQTYTDKPPVIEPSPVVVSSSQAYLCRTSASQSGQLSSQSLGFKESSPVSSAAEVLHHPSQLPLPPPPPFPPLISQGGKVPHMSQTSSSPLPSAPAQSFPPYMLPNQQSDFSVPLASSWSSLPAPPQPPWPPYDSTINTGIAAHAVTSQSLQSRIPRNDFRSEAFMTPFLTELPTHSQVNEFQHQAYPPMQPFQVLLHAEEFRLKPLSAGNPQSQAQFPVQDLSVTNSFTPGHMHLQPTPVLRQLSVNKMQQPQGTQHASADSFSDLPGKISLSRYPPNVPDGNQLSHPSDFGGSRISTYYNPYASTFEQPLSFKFCSEISRHENSLGLSHVSLDGQGIGSVESRKTSSSPNSARAIELILPRSGSDQYDPLFDSIEPSSNSFKRPDHAQMRETTSDNIMLGFSGSNKPLDLEENNNNKVGAIALSTSVDNDEFGETADAEVGAVENGSPSDPVDLADMNAGEVEIDQVKSSGKSKKSKDSRSSRLFKIAIADFVKEVLKPSWRQGNMSKEAFKTIVKKTVDKVSGAMKSHQIPKSETKINQYIDSSQRKLTKLVMGYVDKYVKV